MVQAMSWTVQLDGGALKKGEKKKKKKSSVEIAIEQKKKEKILKLFWKCTFVFTSVPPHAVCHLCNGTALLGGRNEWRWLSQWSHRCQPSILRETNNCRVGSLLERWNEEQIHHFFFYLSPTFFFLFQLHEKIFQGPAPSRMWRTLRCGKKMRTFDRSVLQFVSVFLLQDSNLYWRYLYYEQNRERQKCHFQLSLFHSGDGQDVWCLFTFRGVMWVLQPFGFFSIIKKERIPRGGLKRRLTVEVEKMLVVADLGYVSGRHGVRGGNQSTQAGSPHFIRSQSVLLGFIMWRECTGPFCNNTFQNDKQAVLGG